MEVRFCARAHKAEIDGGITVPHPVHSEQLKVGATNWESLPMVCGWLSYAYRTLALLHELPKLGPKLKMELLRAGDRALLPRADLDGTPPIIWLADDIELGAPRVNPRYATTRSLVQKS